MVIHAAAGDYPGIITSVPPHLAGDGSDHSIKIENLLIDTGFTAETAAKLFAPGDIVTFAAKPVELQNKRLAGPALDDRIGCAAVIAAAEEIAAEKPDCKVMVGGAVLNQEYADMIGADFYGKDAMQSVYYAQNVFGEES